MNISIYTRGSMTNWYPVLLQRVLIELGHSSKLISALHNDSIDDDITFFIPFGYPMWRELPRLQGKTKCIALIETEQILPGLRYYNRFQDDSSKSDIVIFPFSKKMDVGGLTKKPVLNMPLGYHPSLQCIGNPMPRRNIFLLEGFDRGYRKPFHGTLEKAGFSLYNDLYIYDLQKIANRVISSDICLTTHAYGPGSFLAAFRVVGLFMYNRGFVMSERASEPFFEENKHIVYFDTPKEMVKKCQYYISDQVAARKIAEEAYTHLQSLAMIDVVRDTVNKICELRGL